MLNEPTDQTAEAISRIRAAWDEYEDQKELADLAAFDLRAAVIRHRLREEAKFRARIIRLFMGRPS